MRNPGRQDPRAEAETLYSVGGGPSLRGFDWDRLGHRRVIAVNRAFEALPGAEIVYFTDARFWRWHHEPLKEHAGRLITAAREARIIPPCARLEFVRITGTKGLDTRPGHVRSGNNSGYAAINLAVHEGAKRIVLLGYDMAYQSNEQGGTHWHDGYPTGPGRVEKMLPFFDSLVEPLRELDIEVINANPDSAIQCFPKCALEEAL